MLQENFTMPKSREDRNALDRSDDLSVAFQMACLDGSVESWRKVYEMASELKQLASSEHDYEAVEDFTYIGQLAAGEVARRVGKDHDDGVMNAWDGLDEEELPTMSQALPQAMDEAVVLLGMARDLVADLARVAGSSLLRKLGL